MEKNTKLEILRSVDHLIGQYGFWPIISAIYALAKKRVNKTRDQELRSCMRAYIAALEIVANELNNKEKSE